jgi:hypothetical protein
MNFKKEVKGQGQLLDGEESRGFEYRTKIERTTQVIQLLNKLKSVTQLHEGLSAVKEFKKEGNEFIKTGKRFEGSLKFTEDPRLSLFVKLEPKKTKECEIFVKNHKMGKRNGF